jgi:hypothetical protein
MPCLGKSCWDCHIGPAVALGCLLGWTGQNHFVIAWTFSWVEGTCEFTSYSIRKSALCGAELIIVTDRIGVACVTAEGRSPISGVQALAFALFQAAGAGDIGESTIYRSE